MGETLIRYRIRDGERMNKQSLREGLLRIVALFRRARGERDMADELAFHLAMKQQKYIKQRGLNSTDAMAVAKRELGGVEKWKEACRDVNRARAIEDLARDLALAARMLRKTPAFTAAALLTLTLAIGSNTAIFSLINAVLLRPLNVPAAHQLTVLRIQPADSFGYAFSYPLFKYLEKDTHVFSHTFGFAGRNLQIHTANGVERIPGQLVSGHYFSALQVNPQLGRYITPSDDRPGVPSGAVAVISDRFWRNWFNASPKVLGQAIALNNVVVTVVGVMPEGFTGADRDQQPDVFVPMETEPLMDAPYSNIAAGMQANWFNVGARLHDGITLERAAAYLRSSSRAIYKAIAPEEEFRFSGNTHAELYVTTEPGITGYSYLRLRFTKPFSLIMALVILVLFVACLNLATLLMARASSRERELATRLALGASRGRLMRQLLTESLLLAMLGTALGSATAPFAANLLTLFLASPDPLQPTLNITPDLRVFAFTAIVAALATILTGLAPALRSTGRNLQAPIREGCGTLRGTERRRLWPNVLSAAEVAFALMLITGASLLGFSLVKLHRIPVGFDPQGLVFLQFDMSKQSRDGKALIQIYRDIETGLAAMPGITSVSFVDMAPLYGSWWTGDVATPGNPPHELFRNHVGPEYFRAMRTPLLGGREFRWSDTDESGRVAIINEAAARILFPSANPVGQRIAFDGGKTLADVVGVVADAKYAELRDSAPPAVYSSITQDMKNRLSLQAIVRLRNGTSPVSVVASAGRAIRKLDDEIPPPVATTMEQTISQALSTERMMASLGLFFAGVALLITGIGLYGTLTYTTARRTGEIGIRIAIGARRGDVIGLVCRANVGVALAGCVGGLLASLATSRLIASFLYNTSPKDPVILGTSALVLICVAVTASLLPAIRASRIDPITAIRYE